MARDGGIDVVRHEGPSGLQRRVVVAGLLAAGCFAALGGRLWYLQLELGAEMRRLSEHNRIRLRRVRAPRGIIYDRHHRILVENRPSFDMVVVPEDTPDLHGVLRALARYLGEEPSRLEAKVRAPTRRPPYEGIVLERDIEWRSVVALETHQLDLPGVSLQVAPRRFYPMGSLAAHVLGYVGEVTAEDLARERRYRPGDIVGKAGLEKRWDERIRGVAGGEQVEVDALGRRMRVLREVPEVPGNNLVLTLDAGLQQAAERILGERDGALVALDPRNGAVLAMVSHPAFDPNAFARGVRREQWRRLLDERRQPLNNRALRGLYPPGSTFKIAVAAAALEEGVINPFTRIYCSGGWLFGGHYFHCWKRGGHGWVDLHRALVESCDVFFYQVGRRLGIDAIADYARRLGLGSPTGIDLDGEKAGVVPDSAWKRERFGQPWFPGETLSAAIGQGYVLVTPLQMAVAIATVANGGTRYRPHLVGRVETPAGKVIYRHQPEVVGEAGLRKTTLVELRSALRDVVMGSSGTGRRARVEGVEVAGKTGTAQVVRLARSSGRGKHTPRSQREHAWFVAYAPAGEPEIAVACLVEHAGAGGGTAAAPLVGELLAHYFSTRRVEKPLVASRAGRLVTSNGGG